MKDKRIWAVLGLFAMTGLTAGILGCGDDDDSSSLDCGDASGTYTLDGVTCNGATGSLPQETISLKFSSSTAGTYTESEASGGPCYKDEGFTFTATSTVLTITDVAPAEDCSTDGSTSIASCTSDNISCSRDLGDPAVNVFDVNCSLSSTALTLTKTADGNESCSLGESEVQTFTKQ